MGFCVLLTPGVSPPAAQWTSHKNSYRASHFSLGASKQEISTVSPLTIREQMGSLPALPSPRDKGASCDGLGGGRRVLGALYMQLVLKSSLNFISLPSLSCSPLELAEELGLLRENPYLHHH